MLVTGAAGYIGSHVVKQLLEDTNYEIIIIDNLYIHVCDLADAHIQALKYLETNPSDIFNCGYGYGYSVKEVVETVKKVSTIDFKVDIEKRRIGDPAVLVSDNTKIKTKMNWKPKYNDLELICKTALDWEKMCKSLKLITKKYQSSIKII